MDDPIKSPILKVIVVISILTLIGAMIYAGLTSDDPIKVKENLLTLTSDNIKSIKITPFNKDWKINLTSDTIEIKENEIITKVVNEIKKIDKHFYGKAAGGQWATYLIIETVDGNKIKIEAHDSMDGFLIDFINVMGQQSFYCNGLEKVLEDIAQYKEPIGE